MGGVDRFDQRKEIYLIGRRSVRWAHSIFYFLIGLAIINSFILWQGSKRNTCLGQLTLRIVLARQLIDGYSSRKRKGRPASFQAKECVVSNDVRLWWKNHKPKMVSDDVANVAERNKKRGPATCVQNGMSPCALQHASHLFMANNHHSI
ncbi:piggyBac transposable element-derived protein 4 [Trichonephila clavipes]|nr:piggyBac transposable element-derived protein 4 [Trichonephila clavipes]